ncbi:MAG: M23 family metallopeptidase [Parcubacteria group bacterium]|jgi:murein DD-endopeptidase MepM/ murein hydrolase activator NlpD
MAYPYARQLCYPVDEYRVNGLGFGVYGIFGGVDWGEHLGEDVICSAGTPVVSIGRGSVVYSALHAGSATKGNWGNIIIVVHKHPVTHKLFYTLYGHLGERNKKKGARVDMGDVIGLVGKSNTVDNGWWQEEHLHFGIYVGAWDGTVLPGYFKSEQKRTKKEDWVRPSDFIAQYSNHSPFSKI